MLTTDQVHEKAQNTQTRSFPLNMYKTKAAFKPLLTTKQIFGQTTNNT